MRTLRDVRREIDWVQLPVPRPYLHVEQCGSNRLPESTALPPAICMPISPQRYRRRRRRRRYAFLTQFMGRDDDFLHERAEGSVLLSALDPPGCVCVVAADPTRPPHRRVSFHPKAFVSVIPAGRSPPRRGGDGDMADRDGNDGTEHEHQRLASDNQETQAQMQPQPRPHAPKTALSRPQEALPRPAAGGAVLSSKTTSGIDPPSLPQIRQWRYVFARNVVQGNIHGLAGHGDGAPITTSKVAFRCVQIPAKYIMWHV